MVFLGILAAMAFVMLLGLGHASLKEGANAAVARGGLALAVGVLLGVGLLGGLLVSLS